MQVRVCVCVCVGRREKTYNFIYVRMCVNILRKGANIHF